MPNAILLIRKFSLGQWMTNCYVLHTEPAAPDGSCWIIDAGFDPEPMIAFLKQEKLTPKGVVLTHAHLDHIAGLHALRANWPKLEILCHPAERDFLSEPTLNLSADFDEQVIAPPATGALEHGQRLELNGITFEVRHTPGHSPGGLCLYQRENAVVFAGDVLFAGSVGRCDFPTSDPEQLISAIREQLLTLPPETRVMPGHGPATTIGDELRHNPYIQAG